MISIQTNVASMVAQQNLQVNSQFQSKTIQQLTSGYRINSSSDDAAGLAVANQFRSQTAELTQGVMNANNGISQLQIVDGGLSNISQMLDRLNTLATESASQTFTGDRSTLNNEYQAVMGEINRQADNVGLGANNTSNMKQIGVFIGGGQDANTNSSVNVNLTNSGVDATSLGLTQTSVLTNAAVQVGSVVATPVAATDSAIFNIATTTGVQTITINGQAGDTVQGQVTELNGQLQAMGIQASINQAGKLQFTSANAFSVTANDATADSLVQNAANDTANNTGLNHATLAVRAAGVGTHVEVIVGNTTVTANLTNPAAPTQVDVDSINSALKAQGITSVSAVLDQTGGAGISFQGSTNFSISNDYAAAGTFVAPTADTAAAVGGNPNVAINAIAAALQNLGVTQGKVGAGENTLNYAINLAQSQITNFSSAQSMIRDADVATEAANLTKAQVLQQSSIAAMAQANSAPQALLKLFQ
jgi:flagellin